MMNIFAHYWGWLLVITVIGFVGGMIVHPDEEDTGLPIWFWPLAVLLVLGVVAGKFGFVGSPYSEWTDFAAIAYTGFSLGALAGGFGKKFGLSWGPLLVSALVGSIAMFMTPVSGWVAAEKAAPAAAEAPAASAPASDAAKPAEAAKPGEAVTAAAGADKPADPFAAKPEAATPAPDAAAAAAAAAAKAEEDAKAAAAAKAEEDAKAEAAAKAEDDAKAAAAAKAEEDAKAAAAAKAEEDAKAAAAAKAEEDAKAAAAPAPLTVAALAEQKILGDRRRQGPARQGSARRRPVPDRPVRPDRQGRRQVRRQQREGLEAIAGPDRQDRCDPRPLPGRRQHGDRGSHRFQRRRREEQDLVAEPRRGRVEAAEGQSQGRPSHRGRLRHGEAAREQRHG